MLLKKLLLFLAFLTQSQSPNTTNSIIMQQPGSIMEDDTRYTANLPNELKPQKKSNVSFPVGLVNSTSEEGIAELIAKFTITDMLDSYREHYKYFRNNTKNSSTPQHKASLNKYYNEIVQEEKVIVYKHCYFVLGLDIISENPIDLSPHDIMVAFKTNAKMRHLAIKRVGKYGYGLLEIFSALYVMTKEEYTMYEIISLKELIDQDIEYLHNS